MKRLETFPIVMAIAFLVGMSLTGNARDSSEARGEGPKETIQKPSNPAAQGSTQEADAASVRSNTKIEAELESALDASTAKPGDEVAARVAKDVKQKGKKVIKKGDRLVGRITEVKAESETDAEAGAGSRLAVTFDRLVRGEQTSQLNAVVTSVRSVPAEERSRKAARDRMMESEPVTMPRPAPVARPAPSGGGGLLGGAGSTVGSTVGAAGSAVGGIAGGVGSTVSSTTKTTGKVVGGTAGSLDATSKTALGGAAQAGLTTPRKAVRLDSQSQAQAENQTAVSSVFSTREGDLRMESGTKLEFRTHAEGEARAHDQ